MGLIPEVETLAGSFRARYDPSAAAGMPAHITINCPFLPRLAGDDLRGLFLGYPSFEFILSRVERWLDVLYLAPEPSAPFIELIKHVARWFPDSPPYGGRFADVIPHLTVAHSQDRRFWREWLRSSPAFLPIICQSPHGLRSCG